MRPPEIFQLKFNKNINRYDFVSRPDHLSGSYDYGARNLDEYFHFYSIAGQKLKMQKEIYLFQKIK